MSVSTIVRVSLGAIAFWLFSAIYFTILARPWATAVGKTPEELSAAGMWPYLVALVCAWLLAYGLDVVIAYGSPITWLRGFYVGLFVSMTVFGSSIVALGGFEARSGVLTAIDCGWIVLGATLTGAILGAMRANSAKRAESAG